MFEVSSRAAAVLARSRADVGVPDTTPIRISASESGEGSSAAYQVRFADQPSDGDVELESAGMRVFLAPELVDPLQASMLDTVDSPEGEHLVLKHRHPIV